MECEQACATGPGATARRVFNRLLALANALSPFVVISVGNEGSVLSGARVVSRTFSTESFGRIRVAPTAAPGPRCGHPVGTLPVLFATHPLELHPSIVHRGVPAI